MGSAVCLYVLGVFWTYYGFDPGQDQPLQFTFHDSQVVRRIVAVAWPLLAALVFVVAFLPRRWWKP